MIKKHKEEKIIKVLLNTKGLLQSINFKVLFLNLGKKNPDIQILVLSERKMPYLLYP
jgi:hypothetical protein